MRGASLWQRGRAGAALRYGDLGHGRAEASVPRGARGVCRPLPNAVRVGTGPADRAAVWGAGSCLEGAVRAAAFIGTGCRGGGGFGGAAAVVPSGETGASFGPHRVRTLLRFVHRPEALLLQPAVSRALPEGRLFYLCVTLRCPTGT